MPRYGDLDALRLKVMRYLMPNVDVDGTVSVEDAERYFLKLLEDEPTADVVPKSEVAMEIFEEIYETMNSVYASVQRGCVGMHGDNPETMRLLGKLEGVKRLGDEIAELKKKYTEDER